MSYAIADNFDATNRAIEGKLAAGEQPTSEIISFILKDQTNKAQGLLRKDSSCICHALCVNGFATVGWDFDRNRGVGATPPTIDKVQGMLTATAAKIRACLQDRQASMVPNSEELRDISLACARLWELDINRLTPENGDYEINLQEGKRFSDKRDVAEERLFVQVQRDLLRRPTFSSFLALLNNYEAEVGQAEQVTTDKKAEMIRFIDAICETPCMKFAHKYLVAKKLSPADLPAFKKQIFDIWFNLYNRTRGVRDSSGFEHVFMGEISTNPRDGGPPKVVGLHNWLRIYVEERLRRFNYKGYIKPRAKGGRLQDPMNTEQLLAINFEWRGVEKDASTIFIGTSPEFEIALYTMCFLVSEDEKLVVQLGPYWAEITCHSYNVKTGKAVGTTYPGQAPLTGNQAATKIQAAFRGLSQRRIYKESSR